MAKLWLCILCVFNSLILIYSTEHEPSNVEGGPVYDIDGVFRKSENRYKISLQFKDLSPLHGLRFGGIEEDFAFQPGGLSLLNSAKCLGDIKYILENWKSLVALKLVDSFGKPESGILQGNARWVGDYDECIEIQSTNPNSTAGNFRGQYCSATLTITSEKLPLPFGFSIGLCVPDSCSADVLQEDVHQLLQIAGSVPVLNETSNMLGNVSLTCKPTERHLNGPAKGVIALLSIFLVLVVIGSSITVFHYYKKVLHDFRNPQFFTLNIYESIGDQVDAAPMRHRDEAVTVPDGAPATNEWLGKLATFFGCFCVFTNGAKLLNTEASEGELLCIHGIRFLSMSWVILGHTYMFGIQQIRNMLDLMRYIDTFLFQVVLQGFYSVDSFFVLSGFLLAYLSMKEFAKTKGSISWPYFYFHRFIRLTPMYMVILGFSATVYLYLGSGPYWQDGDIDKNCKESWWKNLIYINNFVDQNEQCMGWAWYLANDMQFFIISPLFLVTLWRWPKVGYSLIGIFMLACWLSNFFITYHFDLMAGMFNLSQAALASMSKFMEFFNKIYIKPYTRIAPYLVGMLTGYLLFKRKASGYPKHNLVFLTVGWIMASAITLTCVFGLYHSNPSTLANSFYNALNRTGFALGLSWVIYVCLIGQGGPVNSFLSFKLFIPLSRLTYAAYLIHPMIIMGYYSSLRASLVFDHPTMVFLFLAFMVVTYGLSLPVALALESPIVSLEKLVRKTFVKKQKSEGVN